MKARLRLKLTLCVVALLTLAGVLGIAFSASASGPGPHWTVEGVAQEGGGSETVSYSGHFGLEIGVGSPVQLYVCKKSAGSGKVLFTSPGTGEGHIELSECHVGSGHESECKLAEPIIINMKIALSSTEGVVYATLEPTNSGSAFMYFGVKNAVEKTCPSSIAGEHVLVGDQGTTVGAEGVENVLTATSAMTLKTALSEQSVRFYGANRLGQEFTATDTGKKLGAK